MRKIGSTIKQAIFEAPQQPVSVEELCKRAKTAILKRIYAMERGLDYKNMTPQSEEEERLASLKRKKCST